VEADRTDIQPRRPLRVRGRSDSTTLMSLLSLPLPELKDKPHLGRTGLGAGAQRPERVSLETAAITSPNRFQEHLLGDPPRRSEACSLQFPYDLFAPQSVEEFH